MIIFVVVKKHIYMHIFNSFAGKNYNFPNEFIDPRDRAEQWFNQYAQALYSEWIRGVSGFGYPDVAQIDLNRSYAAGNQPKELYMDWLLGKKQQGDAKRKGYNNVSFDIFSVAPKFMAVIKAKLMAVDHDVFIDAIDELSGQEKDQKYWELYFKSQNKEILTQMGMVKPDEFIPASKDELDMFAEIRGICLGEEMKMEQAIDYTLYISEWKDIKMKLIEDCVNVGRIGLRHFTDPVTQKAKVEYIDTRNAVVEYSRNSDFNKSNYAGVFVDYTVSDLRVDLAKNSNLTATEIEDKLQDIVPGYYGYAGNPTLETLSYNNKTGDCNYNNFRISVLCFEVKTVNSSKYTKKTKNGVNKFYEEDYKTNKKSTDKKQVLVSDVPVILRCKWIVGADLVWDYGMQYDVPRAKESEPLFSYRFYQMTEIPLTQRLIPLFDSVQKTWLRLQDLISKAKDPSIIVEWGALSNIAIGDANKPLDLIKIFGANGVWFYKASTHKGTHQSNTRPISEFKGGMGSFFYELRDAFEMSFQQISEIAGIDRISAISKSPTANTTVGATQIAAAATDNALTPMYIGYVSLKEKTVNSLILRIQDIIRFNKNKYEGYYNIIGKTGMQLLSVGNEVLGRKFIGKVQARSSAKDIADIERQMESAMMGGKNGIPSIEMEDFFMVKRMLNNPSGIKFCQMYLSFKSKERKKEAQESAMATAQAQSQGNMQADQAKTQNEIMKAKAINKDASDNKIREIYAEAVIKTVILAEDEQKRNAQMAVLQNMLDQLNMGGQGVAPQGMGGQPAGGMAMV